VTITVINISHLSSPPAIPNVKCIDWNCDGSNLGYRDEELNLLRFENEDIIPNVEGYFI
jgi:hypothetical protein